MAKEGAQFENIELREESSNMRGMFAKTEIKKNDIILYVPENLITTIEKAEKSPMGSNWQNLGMLMAPVSDLLATYNL